MRRKLGTAVLAAALALAVSGTAFAAGWQRNEKGWWWQNEDGTYPVNSWRWLDGNQDGIAECYYFDENGYCLQDRNTPDGYTVGENGAWVAGGAVQAMAAVLLDGAGGQAGAVMPGISGSYIHTLEADWNGQHYRVDTVYQVEEQADDSVVLRARDFDDTAVYGKVAANTYQAVCPAGTDGQADRLVFDGKALTESCETYGTRRIFYKQ